LSGGKAPSVVAEMAIAKASHMLLVLLFPFHAHSDTADSGKLESSETCVIDSAVAPKSLEEEAKRCPFWGEGAISVFVRALAYSYKATWARKIVNKMVGKVCDSSQLTDKFADTYTMLKYASIVHLALRKYETRHASSVPIPTSMGGFEEFQVGDIVAPNFDIDQPAFLPGQEESKDKLPTINCIQAASREMPFLDDLDDPEINQWETALGDFTSKKAWLKSFFEKYTTVNGDPIWPRAEVDYSGHFFKNDEWQDDLERAIAFDIVGTHRVRTSSEEFDGSTMGFVLPLNDFSNLKVRKDFGRFGVDMYFTKAGMPALLRTPDRELVRQGDREWQYWKFVWRSSLITIITLVDHLHMTHFRTANLLAAASRNRLPADHPFRRFLSIFTFGTIFVNMNAMHALVGPNQLLHRSSSLKNFEGLADDIMPEMMPNLLTQFDPLHNETVFSNLPEKLQKAPYYADGKLIFEALHNLAKGFFNIYKNDWCADDVLKDKDVINFGQGLLARIDAAGYQNTFSSKAVGCDALVKALTAYLFSVTGWHRHVGSVSELYEDPTLATFSWKEHEAYGRPRQSMLTGVIVAFTGSLHPKLDEDYTHVFKGIPREVEAVSEWNAFREELGEIKRIIEKRNKEREVKNFKMDPSIIECSVAV